METKSTTAFSAAIPVPDQLLDEHNYPEWAIRVRTYLKGQDLWKVIVDKDKNAPAYENDDVDDDGSDDDDVATAINVRRRRNYMALHAIQISCGPNAFSEIRTVCSAKTAWQTLQKKYMIVQDMDKIDKSYLQYADLHKALLDGNWIAAKEILDSQPEAIRKAITDKGETALEIARHCRHTDIVVELESRMSKEDSGIVENRGIEEGDTSRNDPAGPEDDTGNIDENYLQYAGLYRAVHRGDLTATMDFLDHQREAVSKAITNKGQTALHIAVTTGHAHIVQELVSRMSNKDLGIEDGDGYTALTTALVYEKSDLALQLYTRTQNDLLSAEDEGRKGAMFLTRALYSRNLDLALDLIRRYSCLTHALDDRGESPLLALASMQNAFPSGNRLVFWKQWIYSCIRIDQRASPIDETGAGIRDVENQVNSTNTSVPALPLRHLFSNLLNLLGIKQLYEMKKLHIQSQELLNCMCVEISSLKESQTREISRVYDAITCAVKNGISEFVSKVVRTHQRFLENKYINSRSILMLAVIYRQSEIFSDIYHGLDMKDTLTSYRDLNNDNMLHMVGMIEDSTKLNQITGAALQMQRELQWFKEVEKILNPKIKEYTNKDGLTPRELFTKNHENMMEKGEKWVKDTASSGTVVGALVVTIMFVVAFSVPGGNDQNTGLPIFLEKKEFMSFLIVDVLSLFSASISVLIFLEILTSRHAEEDFLESLPKKIFIGIFTLFFSFVTMIMSFSTALSIMLRDQNLWIVIFIKCLPVVPVTFFLLIQYPILVEMIRSTFLLPRIFNTLQEKRALVIKI